MLIVTAAMMLALAVFLSVFLVKSERGPKKPIRSIVAALGFGGLAIAAALALEKRVIPPEAIRQIYDGSLPLPALLGISMAIGYIEEAAKFVPLAIFLNDKKYFTKHIDGVIYFAFSGLAFSMVENAYFLRILNPSVGLLRIVLLLFFHPATSAIVGYYFARFALDKRSLWNVALALAVVSVLHGLYNFGVGSNSLPLFAISLGATLLINVGLVFYQRKASRMDAADEVIAEAGS